MIFIPTYRHRIHRSYIETIVPIGRYVSLMLLATININPTLAEIALSNCAQILFSCDPAHKIQSRNIIYLMTAKIYTNEEIVENLKSAAGSTGQRNTCGQISFATHGVISFLVIKIYKIKFTHSLSLA